MPQYRFVPLMLALLAACSDSGGVTGEAGGKEGLVAAAIEKEFLIAPKIGYMNCDDAGVNIRTGQSCASGLSELMERVEPGGATGNVQFGYTLSLPIFTLFEKKNGQWQFHHARLGMWMDLVREVGRPVVIHVGANHFGPSVPLTNELAQNPKNLLAYADGGSSEGKYFNFSVNMFTFSTDPEIPINYYRDMASREIAAALLQLEQDAPGLVKAVTLVGETYHLSRDIKNRMGNYFDVDFTDYSDVAKREFRAWLRSKYPDIDAFNRAAGTDFEAWSDVSPPHRDFRNAGLQHAWEHFDSFASGEMPLTGWAICKNGGVPVIRVWLDGEYQGDARYGLNRLDVYRNVETIATPNVGFQYLMDYRRLSPGRHRWQAAVRCPGSEEAAIAAADFTALSAEDVATNRFAELATPQRKGFAINAGGARGYLGMPRVEEVVYFNPFAAMWQEFRGYQIRRYLEKSWQVFTAAGFPAEKVYIAQMVPQLQGAWNQAQLAVEQTLEPDVPYQLSLMLYGGLARNEGINAYVEGRAYGVSQFNPLMYKDVDSVAQAIEFQRRNGARFIAPYYMSGSSDRGYSSDDPHTDMLIDPNSPLPESRYLYKAIVEAVKQ